MKNLIRVVITISILNFPVAGQKVLQQENWKYVAGKENIKVYNRPVSNSKIKALKAEMILDASALEVVELIMDVAAAKRWVCHTKSCELIRKVSENELYYYTEVSLPWPLDNRDFVAHIKVSEDPVTKIVTVDAPAVPGWVAKKKGIVRVDHSIGLWKIQPISAKKAKVEYVLQVDPGGAIPAHVVNMFASQGPIETFINMKKELNLRSLKRAENGNISPVNNAPTRH
ncbi:START domain-containing protein [Dyadobacter arcticus]|uniref:START domain-containing protein n=1 Tax=Dyadobacter arcticus TaxID=1078754 RepID=A0ABX0UV13_9BACT|nr:START domain-containing protein [Dyadobacter arcticus]NIJ54771.1 hypothetical protein [Dyadobacter arcticus]